MKAFLPRFIGFVLPFALVTSLIVGMSLWWGLIVSTSQIIALQTHDAQYLYYPSGERDNFLNYKFYSTLYYQPDVLFLGSSRLQFMRPQVVTNTEYSAYNACVVGMRLSELYDFVMALDQANALPQVLVINLDLPDFNANRVAFRQGRSYITDINPISAGQEMAVGARQSLQSFFADPQSFLALEQQRFLDAGYTALGFETIQQGMGYRQDGSFYRRYGNNRNGVDAGLRWVEGGKESFEFGQEVDMNAIDTLNRLLDFTQEKQIVLIGVLPPYHPEVYEIMDFSEEYAYIPAALEQIEASFAAHNALLFDYTDPATLSSVTPDDFFDSWHLAETGNLRMWLTMLESQPDVLGHLADEQSLETMLAGSSRFYLP